MPGQYESSLDESIFLPGRKELERGGLHLNSLPSRGRNFFPGCKT